MKLALLCLCLAGAASAAPSPFHYTPHFTGPRQQAKPLTFSAGQPLPQPPMTGAYSVELIYPSFPMGTAGANGGLPFPSHGFIKYSIPQPPGRQSIEVYYPYDFSQQRILTNVPPMSNSPQGFPFEYPTTNFHQQTIPSFDANPLPSQDPMKPLQDQPIQTNQAPVKP